MTDITCPTCGVALLEHPANRCLDAWVAEKVMGLKPCTAWSLFHWSMSGGEYIHHPESCSYNNKCYPAEQCPHYSNDISAAWEVVEKIGSCFIDHTAPEMGIDVEFFKNIGNADRNIATADTAPLAICRASLLAVLG